jgi:parallel beta-helix repeat protein
MYSSLRSCILLLVLLVSPAGASPCGDTSGPGGTWVACQCGDTVTSSTRLQPTDPVVSTVCPRDGLLIRSGDITLNCADLTLQGGAGAGIDFRDITGQLIQNCTVKSCVVTGFVDGILVNLCDNFRIAANQVIGNIVGIDYGGGALDEGWGQVWKNRAVNNSFDGIYVQGDNNVIAKNRVFGSEFGIFVSGDHNTITGNSAHDGIDGIELFGFHDNQVTHNYSTRNRNNGIVLVNSTGAVVAYNLVWKNKGTGLIVVDSGGTEIRANTGKKNGVDGLSVARTHSGLFNVLRDNEFNLNGRHGICTTPGHIDGGGNTGHNNGEPPDVSFNGC